MSISKTKDLLGQLSKLERTVNEFSFEELSADEAKVLKQTFDNFKTSLEHHIYTPQKGPKITDLSKIVPERDKDQDKQNQLIAHVSHEIRTPLNSIIGFTNLLENEKLNTSQQRKVKAIQFASHSLLKIINEVLLYSKTASGLNQFETIDFKIQHLLNDIMFLSETLVMERHVELILQIDSNVPEIIKGDPSKLSQVLLNVLGNAIKFVNEGHIKLTVSATRSTKQQCVLKFEVSDTGIGISKEKLSTIFESYTQAEDDTFQKYGGTGLGLSITKGIIEKQNGEIVISSQLGKGTSVRFSIPYAIGDLKNIPVKSGSDLDVKTGRKLLSGTKILVFEDNLMNQRLIKEQLTKWGCKVYTEVDLRKGLTFLATQQIDLILMDLKMPDLNGFEITKVIRNHTKKEIRSVPIIAFSADFTEQDTKTCKLLGINDFLLKPYTLEELMNIIVKNKRTKAMENEFTELLQTRMIEPKTTTSIDVAHLLKECFGEIDMLKELVKLFKTNVLEFVGNVKLHLKTNNLKEISLAAHKLKAGFAMLKADGMRALLIEMEAHCKANRSVEVKELYAVFMEEYPVLEENLDYELNLLDTNRN